MKKIKILFSFAMILLVSLCFTKSLKASEVTTLLEEETVTTTGAITYGKVNASIIIDLLNFTIAEDSMPTGIKDSLEGKRDLYKEGYQEAYLFTVFKTSKNTTPFIVNTEGDVSGTSIKFHDGIIEDDVTTTSYFIALEKDETDYIIYKSADALIGDYDVAFTKEGVAGVAMTRDDFNHFTSISEMSFNVDKIKTTTLKDVRIEELSDEAEYETCALESVTSLEDVDLNYKAKEIFDKEKVTFPLTLPERSAVGLFFASVGQKLKENSQVFIAIGSVILSFIGIILLVKFGSKFVLWLKK